MRNYLYQFPVETKDQVTQIGEFLHEKKRDPLLKIGVAVSADSRTLSNPSEIARIESIFHACTTYEGFVAILHFSFRHSSAPKEDLPLVQEKLPFVKHIQVNDIPPPEWEVIAEACHSFLATIPLSDTNFALVHDTKFQETIVTHKAFLSLDNSKGTGTRDTKESLQKKIDTLLAYGLNDIVLCGGFGPDALHTYFELCRQYKKNFSIDAETGLKIDGHVDIEKVKTYLSQLIRSDEPKWEMIEQTKTFLQKTKRSDWETTTIDGKTFSIHPEVFHPGLFPSSAWYADVVRTETRGQKDFCEVGCGAGITSCIVALAHPEMHVVATDINPFASENTRLNAESLGISDRVEVVTGDVFDGIPEGRLFDSIFWAMPFGLLDPGTPMTPEDIQVFDPGYRAIRKFFNTAHSSLKPNGQLLIGFSSDLGHSNLLQELAHQAGITLTPIATQELTEKKTLKFELLRGVYLPQ